MSVGKQKGTKQQQQQTSTSTNTSSQSSRPTNPDEVGAYWNYLNSLSYGRTGRFGASGSGEPISYGASGINQNVQYRALSPTQLRSLGALGATRELGYDRAREDALTRARSDPRLSVAQAQYTNQMTDREWAANRDAVAREAEGMITQAAQADAGQMLNADQFNVGTQQHIADQRMAAQELTRRLTQDDLDLLRSIFFGGMGNYSNSSSQGQSQSQGNSRTTGGGGFNFGINLAGGSGK